MGGQYEKAHFYNFDGTYYIVLVFLLELRLEGAL
jgi:hypothetical protein